MKQSRMKIWAIVALVCCVCVSVVALSACEGVPDPQNITMVAPDGAPALAMAQLVKNATVGGKTVQCSVYPADQIGARAMQSDLAILPSNLAAKIASQNKDYCVLGIVTSGNLYMVGTDNAVQSLQDLDGQSVVSIGQGSVPDLIFRTLLQEQGLTDRVQVSYVTQGSEAIAQLAKAKQEGKRLYAILGEPAVTMAMQKGFARVLDLQTLWQAHTQSDQVGYAQAVLMARKSLCADREWVAALQAVMANNATYMLENTQEALQNLHNLYPQTTLPTQMQADTIQRCNLNYLSLPDNRDMLEKTLQAIYALAPQAIGGAMPSDDFYFA